PRHQQGPRRFLRRRPSPEGLAACGQVPLHRRVPAPSTSLLVLGAGTPRLAAEDLSAGGQALGRRQGGACDGRDAPRFPKFPRPPLARRFPMRRAFKTAARMLTAAGALALAGTAAAQSATPSHANTHSISALSPGDAAGARLDERKVEMGWLGHPMTFPHTLVARADSGVVELKGYVPSQAVREEGELVARTS